MNSAAVIHNYKVNHIFRYPIFIAPTHSHGHIEVYIRNLRCEAHSLPTIRGWAGNGDGYALQNLCTSMWKTVCNIADFAGRYRR